MPKKYYGFGEVFEILDEIDNNGHMLNEYNPTTFTMIDRKNETLESLKIMEWKLLDLLPTPTAVRKKNASCKGYVNKQINEKMNSVDIPHAEAIFRSFEIKRLERIKTES